MQAHINIGSNIGNRAENISRAVSLLGRRVGRVCEVSRPVESEAWGYRSPNVFLNLGVNVESACSGEEILKILKEIEAEIDPCGQHRDGRGGYADRAIDLDLICMGQEVADSPTLTLPHPRMHLREFVLAPMAEILPGWKHPVLGKSVEKLLDELHNKSRIKSV